MGDIDYSKYEPIFGSWHIVNYIGGGSFGKVYEIERNEMGITYRAALKVITIPESRDEIDSAMSEGMSKAEATIYFQNIVQDIAREIVLMSKVKGNSNIVSYEDHMIIEHEDDIGWDILIRMELLTPLVSHANHQSMTEDDVISLGIDMCRALEVCRKNNIIHRDIKPENIFISPNGDYKLGDFGIARTVEKTTFGLSRKGTYLYMAPEIYYGASYGATVDIYSVGLVMYKYLNGGRTPFMPDETLPIIPEDRDISVSKRVGGAVIEPPKYGSDRLKEVVLKACAFRAEDRYQDPGLMRRDLEALKKGEIRSESKSEEKGKKKKIFLALLAVILAVIAGYLAVPKEVTDITGIDENISIYTGDTFKTQYEVEPSRFSDEKISFHALDDSIISVDKEGNIKGIKEGKTELTLKAKEYEEVVIVNVENKIKRIDCKDEVKIEKGESSKFNVKLYPEKFKDEKVVYHMKDESIAKYSDGSIRGIDGGTTSLVIKAGGYEKKVKITVLEPAEPIQVTKPADTNVQPKTSSSTSKETTRKKTTSKNSSSEGYFNSDYDQTFD